MNRRWFIILVLLISLAMASGPSNIRAGTARSLPSVVSVPRLVEKSKVVGGSTPGENSGMQAHLPAVPGAESVHAPAATRMVTSTADSGPGALRQALLDAVNGDTITFDPAVFPLGSLVTITLTSGPLPDITQGDLTIDGRNAGVVLDGSALGSGDGFRITSNGNVIQGLQILYFPGNGILIDNGASYNLIGGSNASPGGVCSGECNLISGNGGAGVKIFGADTMSNTVSGNYIGTDVAGTVAVSNTQAGVQIGGGAQYNVIGGDTPGERNVISGNGWEGIWIDGTDTDHNTVSGNYIGTDAGGTTALGNGAAGISIWAGASQNTLGGDTPGERNLISGNNRWGVDIAGSGTMGNMVSGNHIGTDISGTAAVGNTWGGVAIEDGAQHNLVGGSASSERNVISGNEGDGVFIVHDGTDHNTVSGNHIGTDINGTSAIPNDGFGVFIRTGAQHNTIGGDTPGERNLISGNGNCGVVLMDEGTNDNVVSGNYIGIDLNGTKVIHNHQCGVGVWGGAQYNVIGGTLPGERNVISGNTDPTWDAGVWISDADNNTVSGNFIGTDASGTATLGNGPGGGVFIIDGASNNVIGGDTPGERNLISGNNGWGVEISGSGTMSNTVSGNYIGTNVSGTAAISNAWAGIQIDDDAQYNVIGGDTSGERNLISGNGEDGVNISGSGTTSNTISGNYIGTDVSGIAAIPNNGDGVSIWGGASQNTIGVDNTIAFNDGHGVQVEGSNTLGNTVSQNSIHSNDGLGIELANGGNAELPAPVITAYDLAAGTASGTACTHCTIEVFSDAADEGRRFEGSATADAGGRWSLQLSPGSAFIGPNLTASATDADGNTSEFGGISVRFLVYLPIVLRNVGPPSSPPVLNDISNPDGTGNYTVSWSAVSGATSYTLEEDDNDTFSSPTIVYSGPATSTAITGRDVGTYYYRVKASNAFGSSDWSTVKSVTVTVPPPPVPQPPVLYDISNPDGTGNYTVTWSAVTGAISYTLEEDDNDTFSSPTIVYSGPATSAAITGRDVGTYYYRVKASNASGSSDWSEVKSVVVTVPPPPPDFELGAWPATQTITQGLSVSYAVVVTAVNDFTQAVTLDVSGVPTGTTISWATNPLTPTAETALAITTSASSPTGTFALVVTGTGGGQVHSVPLTLTITPRLDLFDRVLQLDGDDDYAASSDSSDLDIGDEESESLTVEAWFNIADLNPSTEQYKVIACKWESYCLVVHQRPDQPANMVFRVWPESSGSITMIVGIGYLTTGWHHVAGVFDNPVDELRLYYEGARKATSASISTDNLNNSTHGLTVGGTSVGEYDYLDGAIEDVRLSGIPRYSGDIYSVPSSPFACDANTRALWHFDEVAGATIFYDGEDGIGSGCGSIEDTLRGMNGAATGS